LKGKTNFFNSITLKNEPIQHEIIKIRQIVVNIINKLKFIFGLVKIKKKKDIKINRSTILK
jgi:hypothetical protein